MKIGIRIDTFFTFQVTDVIYMVDLWKIKPGNSSKKSVGRKSNFEYDFNNSSPSRSSSFIDILS